MSQWEASSAAGTQGLEGVEPELAEANRRPAARAGETAPSLKRKAYHSATWAVIGFVASSTLRLTTSLILTRLLMPQVFGLMALVHTLIRGFELFSDVGVGFSIIKEKKGDDPSFLNTAWTMQILRGFGLWGCIAIAAWPLATFYDKPQLGPLLTAAGMEVAISGFCSTSLILFRRKLELHRTVRMQIVGQLVNLVVSSLLAFWLRSVWALVFGLWVGAIYTVVASHLINTGMPNRLHWDRQAVRKIFHFGRWVFLSTALMYLSTQVDKLMLGKMIPLAVFGAYSIATNIVEIPRSLLTRISEMVIFPAVSRRAELPRSELRAKLVSNRRPVLLAMACGLGVLTAVGDKLLLLLYPAKFAAAAWMLPILAFGIWPRALNMTINGALRALGQLHYNPIGSVLRLALIGFGLPMAYAAYGLPGVIVVVALADVPDQVASTYGRWRHGLATWKQDVGTTMVLLVVFGVLLLIRLAIGWGTPFDAVPWPWVPGAAAFAAPGPAPALPEVLMP